MNTLELHSIDKPVSALKLFSADEGNVLSLQILEGARLKEHITKVPALLVCLNGQVKFENVADFSVELNSGDYVAIEPNVMHWVDGLKDSQLLLIK